MTDTDKSQTVRAGSNTYFFDLKHTEDGNPYLVVTQSRFKGEGKGYDRTSIAVYPESADKFVETAQYIIDQLS